MFLLKINKLKKYFLKFKLCFQNKLYLLLFFFAWACIVCTKDFPFKPKKYHSSEYLFQSISTANLYLCLLLIEISLEQTGMDKLEIGNRAFFFFHYCLQLLTLKNTLKNTFLNCEFVTAFKAAFFIPALKKGRQSREDIHGTVGKNHKWNIFLHEHYCGLHIWKQTNLQKILERKKSLCNKKEAFFFYCFSLLFCLLQQYCEKIREGWWAGL